MGEKEEWKVMWTRPDQIPKGRLKKLFKGGRLGIVFDRERLDHPTKTPIFATRSKRFCVALLGRGPLTTSYFNILSKNGVGIFKLADGLVDTNYEATLPNGEDGGPEVLFGLLRRCYSNLKTSSTSSTEQPDQNLMMRRSVDRFLAEANIVLDSLEGYSVDLRRHIYRRAYEEGIPVLILGPLGQGAVCQFISPLELSFDEYSGITDEMSEVEKRLRFSIGLAPKNLKDDYSDQAYLFFRDPRHPPTKEVMHMCALYGCFQIFNFLSGQILNEALPRYQQYDRQRCLWFKGKMKGGHCHPHQRLKLALLHRSLQEKPKKSNTSVKKDLEDMGRIW